MTVYDLLNLFTEDSQWIELYDLNKNEVIASMEAGEILANGYGDYEIMTIDTITSDSSHLVINI